jgi:hypothetical protein
VWRAPDGALSRQAGFDSRVGWLFGGIVPIFVLGV